MYTLHIYTNDYLYTPVVSGPVTLATSRAGAPGALTFRVVKDSVISFQEGDRVAFDLDGRSLFYGYVFTKRRSAQGVITVKAYDQLRYFKNRDTYSYAELTATDLLRRIARDFSLTCGTLADTGYAIPARVESGQSLFSIAQTALDLTFAATGELFVLYDDYGALRLSNIKEMLSSHLLSTAGISDFDYASSIDSGTYTSVRLAREESGTGQTVYYTAENPELAACWGVLQYYGTLDEEEDGAALAESLLAAYGKRTRRLAVSGAVGNPEIRAGCLLPVQMELGDLRFNDFLMAETVTHTFTEVGHTMDLTMAGGEFVE